MSAMGRRRWQCDGEAAAVVVGGGGGRGDTRGGSVGEGEGKGASIGRRCGRWWIRSGELG